MNKRKILTLALAVCMVAILAIGGSLAYLTDTEGAKNVMTVGNVSIVQDETNEEGTNFQDGQKMYPYTGSGDMMNKENQEYIETDYFTGYVPKTDNNWITKLVTVLNDGSEDAYVRTLFAFQILSDGTIAADPVTGDLAWRTQHGLWYNLEQHIASVNFYKDANGDYVTYTNGDKSYIVGEYLYMNNGDSMLKGSATTGTVGERSHPSLVSVTLESYVDNDEAAKYEDYEILVVSQAVQTKGFTDKNGNGVICDDALNEAFGAVADADNDKLAEWFANAL